MKSFSMFCVITKRTFKIVGGRHINESSFSSLTPLYNSIIIISKRTTTFPHFPHFIVLYLSNNFSLIFFAPSMQRTMYKFYTKNCRMNRSDHYKKLAKLKKAT